VRSNRLCLVIDDVLVRVGSPSDGGEPLHAGDAGHRQREQAESDTWYRTKKSSVMYTRKHHEQERADDRVEDRRPAANVNSVLAASTATR